MTYLQTLYSDIFKAAGICLVLATMSSSAVAAPQESTAEPPRGPKWDMIRFEVKSWGKQVYSWQFGPRYGGVHIENVTTEDVQPRELMIAYRTLEADPTGYRQLERILDGLPIPAPDSAECENFIPDLVYGTIRLTRGATTTEISWNSGCQDRGYLPFLGVLRDADTLVSGWAKDVPIRRTEKRGR